MCGVFIVTVHFFPAETGQVAWHPSDPLAVRILKRPITCSAENKNDAAALILGSPGKPAARGGQMIHISVSIHAGTHQSIPNAPFSQRDGGERARAKAAGSVRERGRASAIFKGLRTGRHAFGSATAAKEFSSSIFAKQQLLRTHSHLLPAILSPDGWMKRQILRPWLFLSGVASANQLSPLNPSLLLFSCPN